MRTKLASGFVAASLAFLLLGLASRRWEYALVALVPLVFLAFGALFPPAAPIITATRELSRDRTQVGGEVEVRVRIRNEGRSADLLEVLDSVPPALTVVGGTNHAIVSLAEGEVHDLRYVLQPALKGDYHIGPTRVRALDPLALGAEDAVVAPATPVVVAPAMENLIRTKLGPRRTRPWFGHVASRQIGVGSDFWGVREYLPGDELRKINWKASARLGRLCANEYEGERSGDVVIILDARRESAIGNVNANAVEFGVRAALGVAEAVLASKNRVGLIVQRNLLDWVPPAFGRKQLYRILDHLIHVRAAGEWPFTYVAWVLSRYFPRDAMVVLISPLTDRMSLAAVMNLAALGYDVTVLSPSPLEIEKGLIPQSVERDTAYRLLVLERENLVSQLRRVAQVVDWDPSTPLALPLRRMRSWARPA